MSAEGNIDPQPLEHPPQPEPGGSNPSMRVPVPRSRDGRFGWVIAAIVVIAVIALVGMGLFLPPFSLGGQLFGAPYTALNAQSPSVSKDNLTLAVDPQNPGSLSVRIKAITPPNTDDWGIGVDQQDAGWLRYAHMALIGYLHLSSPIYRIDTIGAPPNLVSLSIGVPAFEDASSFDLYEYDQQQQWQFVPAQASSDGTALVANVKRIPARLALFKNNYPAALISAVVEAGQPITPSMAETFNMFFPAGMQPTAAGTLQGVLPAGIEFGRGYGITPVIRNFSNPAAVDVATVTGLLQNADLRAYHVDRLVDFAASKAYHGLGIDYRKLPADQRDNFTAFITELAQKLHAANRGLTVTVPFPAQDGSSFNTGAYDWRAIGAVSDTVQIMLPLDPQIFAGQINHLLVWAVGEVERVKLQAALSVQSVQETEGVFAPVTLAEALAPLGRVVAQPNMVPPNAPVEAGLSGYKAQFFMPSDSSRTLSIKYFAPDGRLVSTVWLTTGGALGNRLGAIAAHHLSGVMALDIASPGAPADALSILNLYKLNQLYDLRYKPPTLDWIVSAQGTVIATASGAPGTPFVYKPDERNNSIQINAQVASATLGPANIVVSSALPPPPTATPSRAATSTPPPTSTPRPTRSPAPTETQAASRLGSSGAYRSNRSFS
ncbi:MAG: hypothetical protein IT324_26085 [Anaerolineae bacterium]|nr:hypothetical protein [Anaerolineae bacterium]